MAPTPGKSDQLIKVTVNTLLCRYLIGVFRSVKVLWRNRDFATGAGAAEKSQEILYSLLTRIFIYFKYQELTEARK